MGARLSDCVFSNWILDRRSGSLVERSSFFVDDFVDKSQLMRMGTKMRDHIIIRKGCWFKSLHENHLFKRSV